MQKVDQRRKNTELALRQALFSLLQTNSINQITVTSLCKKAGVSRRTFYVHYDKVTNIFVDYQDQLYLQVVNALENSKSTANTLLDTFDKILKSNFTGFRYLCINEFHHELITKLQKLVSNALIESLHHKASAQDQVVLEFLAVGIIQTYIYWFTHSDKLSYEELTKINRKIVTANLSLIEE